MPFIDLIFNTTPVQVVKPQSFSFSAIKQFAQYYMYEVTRIYDRSELLNIFCIFIIVVFILKNIASYFQTYFMATVDQGMLRDIRSQLYSHFHKLSLSYFTDERKGMLISRIINDTQILRDSIVAVINSFFRDPPVIIMYSLVLFILDWKLTLYAMLLVPVIGIILSKIGDSLKRKSIRTQDSIADVTSTLDETFGAIRIVKAFSMEKYEIEKFQRQDNKYFKLLTSLVRRRALSSPITEVIGTVAVAVILFIFGRQIISGESSMSPGTFLAYLAIFFQMMPSLKLFGQVFNSIKEGIAAGSRIFGILDIQPKILDKSNAIEISSFTKDITYRNVDFKYEKSDLILKNINCSINKGEIVAIVGPSGAGKSSFIDLIPRFYDVESGLITIDGHDLRDLKIHSLRALMGIVTQETILFNDTVKNNISYGSSEKSNEDIISAAKAANAHDFILNLTNGYDTFIGDRGVKLSGGERQRISIARALLKNPPILILDEATSSLDTESEVLVQQAIERLMEGRTSVVIAHRLSTIRNANKILVLDDGRISEIGTHTELISHNGLYKKLYDMQFKL
ncbi:MAG: ABC transporter transmembrane domain-containing protein [bacterium]